MQTLSFNAFRRTALGLVWLCAVLNALPCSGQSAVRVACVGNSITYGMKLADPATESYPARLQQLLGPGYDVRNFGHSGTTLLRRGHRPYVAQTEYRAAVDFKADVVVVHLGTNDTDPRNWPNYRDEFEADYLALIDSLRSGNPQARVIVAQLAPIGTAHPRFRSGTHEWELQISEAIARVARAAGAELISFHSPLYANPELLPDAVHPNAEGAARLARAVFEAITGQYGGLQLPLTFSDYMVLQRRRPLCLRGTADTGTQVELILSTARGKVVARGRAVADNCGSWAVTLPPLEAADELTLEVKATQGKPPRFAPKPQDGEKAAPQAATFRHVAVGEVWLCSGQSNMAFRVGQMGEYRPADSVLADPQLRLLDMKERYPTDNVAWTPEACADVARHDYFLPAAWQPATVQTAQQFSAVAYWFGRQLRDSLQVPVGLICNAIGGSTAEAWIDRATLEARFPDIVTGNWLENDFIQDWCRGRAARNLERSTTAAKRHPYEPCYLYEAAIEPLRAYPVNGVIWYQGESNAHNAEAHERLFPLLVDSWRQTFGNASLPFLFVQLSSLNRPSWPWFRDSQRRLALSIPHTGLAVSSDVGDSLDVHPRNKRPVGERLGALALKQVYGLPVDLCPLPVRAVAQGKTGRAVSIQFAAGQGQTAFRTSDDLPPRTFELAGPDGIFHPADAKAGEKGIVVSSSAVKQPQCVRYGWQPFTRANVVSATGKPLSTFRLDVEAP